MWLVGHVTYLPRWSKIAILVRTLWLRIKCWGALCSGAPIVTIWYMYTYVYMSWKLEIQHYFLWCNVILTDENTLEPYTFWSIHLLIGCAVCSCLAFRWRLQCLPVAAVQRELEASHAGGWSRKWSPTMGHFGEIPCVFFLSKPECFITYEGRWWCIAYLFMYCVHIYIYVQFYNIVYGYIWYSLMMIATLWDILGCGGSLKWAPK
jgi:hypothetical protein